MAIDLPATPPPDVPVRGETSALVRIPLSEVVASLSKALDLTEGQPLGHSVRACIIGMRLGQEIGLDEERLGALYYALLLKDAGCSSNASRMAALFGSDDRAVKPQMKVVDWDDKMRLAVETWRNTGLQSSIVSRVRYFLGIARQEQMSRDMIAARCERGADIARRLGFPDETVTAIHSLDEHWNGNGYPEGRRGDEIPLFSRILNIAQTAEVFLAKGGSDAALVVLRERRGRWFDPALVDTVVGWRADGSWWNSVTAPDQMAHATLLEPAQHAREVDDAGLDRVAEAFAEIIDAKSPFTYKHSSNVAMYACAIGERLGFDARTMQRTRRAGLLHDIGKVGVSNRILDKNGPLADDERAAVQSHPMYTWEILGRVSAFASFARQAATHHEKLDGSGYPWKLRGDELDKPSRAMVVADIYEALTADRPYRAGMPVEKALAILEQERGDKLDGDAIDALAEAVSGRERETGAL
ncbi:MAG: HD domain-containing protein [Gemmatimonadetes bacterium]|nr:HD domain-containing protein [Gemmatimonadota bacterium]MBK6457369.1 HD domain-containing protein [Gemmatimonadota bacterium]MBK9408649.1 HD domain-containing protein [Gemmatimonadota bacterium]MBK9978171.1 HD domain-containing protein [Gemmatimonadota bacterium]